MFVVEDSVVCGGTFTDLNVSLVGGTVLALTRVLCREVTMLFRFWIFSFDVFLFFARGCVVCWFAGCTVSVVGATMPVLVRVSSKEAIFSVRFWISSLFLLVSSLCSLFWASRRVFHSGLSFLCFSSSLPFFFVFVVLFS